MQPERHAVTDAAGFAVPDETVRRRADAPLGVSAADLGCCVSWNAARRRTHAIAQQDMADAAAERRAAQT